MGRVAISVFQSTRSRIPTVPMPLESIVRTPVVLVLKTLDEMPQQAC